MPWEFVLSPRFLVTFGIVLLPMGILLLQVWRTWNPVAKELE